MTNGGAVGPWLAQARAAARGRDFSRAVDLLNQARERDPGNSDVWFGLAVMYQSLNDPAQAEFHYRKVCELLPGDAVPRYNLGVLLQQAGRLEDAAGFYRQAVALDARLAQAWNNLGNVLLRLGRPDEAEPCYRQVLMIWPEHMDAHYNLGLCLYRRGELEAAEAAFRQVLAARPRDVQAMLGLGAVAYDAWEAARGQGDAPVPLHDPLAGETARGWYEQVLRTDSGSAEAYYRLGKIAQERGQMDAAVGLYRRALSLAPGNAQPGLSAVSLSTAIHYALGTLLRRMQRLDEWIENFQDFRRAGDDPFLVAMYGLQTCRYLADTALEDESLAQVLDHSYTQDELMHLSAALGRVLYFDVPPGRMLALYRQYDALMRQKVGEPFALPPRPEGRRLRVGYLSPDLRKHVMGWMMSQVLPRHDRSRFEVYCYALNFREDELTREIRGQCDGYVSVAGLPARRAAERIRADDLDILVDLGTHTSDANPEILAYKPARVQMTHIASAGATGLSTIDFKLTDRYCDPPENQAWLLETLLPVDGCIFPYRHIEPAVSHGYSRTALGIGDDVIVLGAFVNLVKLGARCLAVWRRVLERLPQARLAFSPIPETQTQYYLRAAAQAGIPEDRILVIPPGRDPAENAARYSLVDMVLDTFPYGGVNGVLEPLDMGVPVVTLRGRSHGERTAYSILANLGVTETVADDENGYVEAAARLAEDPAFNHRVRDAIRAGLAHSSLVDMDVHVRHLEDAYLRALALKGLA